MPSSFENAWLKSSPAIDKKYGAPFLYSPMRRMSSTRSITDPERSPMQIVAALDPHGVILPQIGKRLAENTVAEESGATMAIDIARYALPYGCRNGDLLTRLDTNELFEVSGVQDDFVARIVLRVYRRSSK